MMSGELRQYVTIQRPLYVRTPAGDTLEKWVDLVSVRAAIRHLTAREADRFARLQVVVTHNLTMCYYPGVDETMRIKWEGKILSIAEIGLDPTGRSVMNLKCTELKPDTGTEEVEVQHG